MPIAAAKILVSVQVDDVHIDFNLSALSIFPVNFICLAAGRGNNGDIDGYGRTEFPYVPAPPYVLVN